MKSEAIGLMMLAPFLLGVAAPGVEASTATHVLCPNTYLVEPVTLPISHPTVGVDYTQGHAWIFMEDERDESTKTGSLTGRTCTDGLDRLPCGLLPVKMDGVFCDTAGDSTVNVLRTGAGSHYEIRIHDPS